MAADFMDKNDDLIVVMHYLHTIWYSLQYFSELVC